MNTEWENYSLPRYLRKNCDADARKKDIIILKTSQNLKPIL